MKDLKAGDIIIIATLIIFFCVFQRVVQIHLSIPNANAYEISQGMIIDDYIMDGKILRVELVH